MSGRRDGFGCLVSGLLLLLACGLGFLAVGAMVVPEVVRASQRCLQDGPFPLASWRVLEGGSVEQQWQWAPMGRRCEWRYPDGHLVTVTAASWGGTALGAGSIVGVGAGAALVVTGLARFSRQAL